MVESSDEDNEDFCCFSGEELPTNESKSSSGVAAGINILLHLATEKR